MQDSIVVYLASAFLTLTFLRITGLVEISQIHMVGFALSGFLFAISDFIGQLKIKNRKLPDSIKYAAVLAFMVIPFIQKKITDVIVQQWDSWLGDTVTLATLSVVFLMLWRNEYVRNKATVETISESKETIQYALSQIKELESEFHEIKEEMKEDEAKKAAINRKLNEDNTEKTA